MTVAREDAFFTRIEYGDFLAVVEHAAQVGWFYRGDRHGNTFGKERTADFTRQDSG